MDFDFVYAMEDESFYRFFRLIESFAVSNFLSAPSLDVYTTKLLCNYEKSSVDANGKIPMNVNDHSLIVDKCIFVSVFQLPTEDILRFYSSSANDMEEMILLFSSSMTAVKNFAAKKDLKLEYQLLPDVVLKALISNAGSFTAITMEKFQVMTTIMKSMKINWSSFQFNTLKYMMQHSKK